MVEATHNRYGDGGNPQRWPRDGVVGYGGYHAPPFLAQKSANLVLLQPLRSMGRQPPIRRPWIKQPVSDGGAACRVRKYKTDSPRAAILVAKAGTDLISPRKKTIPICYDHYSNTFRIAEPVRKPRPRSANAVAKERQQTLTSRLVKPKICNDLLPRLQARPGERTDKSLSGLSQNQCDNQFVSDLRD